MQLTKAELMTKRLVQGLLYSLSVDGSVKMWDACSLELVECLDRAHEGGKIHCGTIGPDGNLYTGGGDKVQSNSRHPKRAVQALVMRLIGLMHTIDWQSCSLWWLEG